VRFRITEILKAINHLEKRIFKGHAGYFKS
ncbi:MAG: hypothetical protein ACI9UV_001595, partial [Algoriphagus sp.]